MMVAGQLAPHENELPFLFRSGGDRYTIMNRAVVIEQLKQTQDRLRNCWRYSKPGSTQVCRTPTPVASTISAHLRPTEKGGKAIEAGRSLNLPKTAELGFNGEFHVWEHLLRIHDCKT